MKSGFDLSLVISLSSSLSAGVESLSVKIPTPNRDGSSKEQALSLGDFSTVWQFLDSSVSFRPQHDGPRASAHVTPLPTVTATSLEKDESVTPARSGKENRHVTFDANLPAIPLKPTVIEYPTSSPGRKGVTAVTDSPSRPVIRSATTAAERKVAIIQKLLTMFPRDTAGLLSPSVGLSTQPTDIHVFVDNSNVLISFYDLIKKARGFSKYEAVRRPAFSFHGFSLILERGRAVAKKVLVGSSPITPVVLEARALGYETSILERVVKEMPASQSSASSGSESAAKNRIRKVEQAVDEIIHLKILESLLDYPPSTIVLASGDGAAGEYSPGFTKVIERCLMRGWAVEVLSFKQNLNGFYKNKEFKKTWKDRFRFIPLDEFVEELLD